MSKEWSSRRSFNPRRAIAMILLAMAALAVPVEGVDIARRPLVSRLTGHTYRIYVHLPEDYSESDRSYDVLYLLDGDRHFGGTVDMLRARAESEWGRDIIIVGIGYGKSVNRRKRDYTPVKVPGFPMGGGVKKFYKFLRKELVPHIDRIYRTNAGRMGRCIAGHSLGGIAVCYGLMYHHDVFGRFIAISPALWWGGGLFINRYKMNFAGLSAPPALRYYSASGSLEDPSMEALAKQYARRADEKAAGKILIRYSQFEGMGHDDIVIPALMGGLDFVFAPDRDENEPASPAGP
ncbi:MAG: alpha/beta hydrolase-fold protein [Spirochaetes bacterium]|jgi:hypothetical protein|nr:alpha/beta hydrolase-fold protein [Spirochaetota bacterium]